MIRSRSSADLDPAETTKDLEYPTMAQVGTTIFTVKCAGPLPFQSRNHPSLLSVQAFSADHYTGIKLAVTEVGAGL